MSTEDTQTVESSTGLGTESAVADTATTSTETTASTDTTAAASAASDTTEFKDNFKPKSVADAMKEAAPVVPAQPTYQPNYKYKAALQEKEIEEWLRPLIKDADTEKKIKDLLTRVDGFDAIKSSREKVQQEYGSLLNDYQAQQQVVQRVESALEKGDLSSAFRQLGLKKEDIYRWTRDQIQLEELPPEQRKALEDGERIRAEQYQMQDQLAQYQKLYQEQTVQARTMQLDMTLNRPDVVQARDTWDGMMGQHGAFRNLVIQEAQNYYYQTQSDISAEQAVQLVMQKYGKILSGQEQQVAPPAQTFAPQQQGQQVMAPQKKPVIPQVNGKGASPIKKAPRSLDDLNKIRKQMDAETVEI